jgi:hypothetical protein
MKWTGEHAIGTELLSGLMLWEKKKRKRNNYLTGKPGLCGHLTREVLSSHKSS